MVQEAPKNLNPQPEVKFVPSESAPGKIDVIVQYPIPREVRVELDTPEKLLAEVDGQRNAHRLMYGGAIILSSLTFMDAALRASTSNLAAYRTSTIRFEDFTSFLMAAVEATVSSILLISLFSYAQRKESFYSLIKDSWNQRIKQIPLDNNGGSVIPPSTSIDTPAVETN